MDNMSKTNSGLSNENLSAPSSSTFIQGHKKKSVPQQKKEKVNRIQIKKNRTSKFVGYSRRQFNRIINNEVKNDCQSLQNIGEKINTSKEAASSINLISSNLGNCSKQTIAAPLLSSRLKKYVADDFSTSESDDEEKSFMKLHQINSVDDKEVFITDENFSKKTENPSLISNTINTFATDAFSTSESDIDDLPPSSSFKFNSINSLDKEFFHFDKSTDSDSSLDLSEFENQNLSDEANSNILDSESDEEENDEIDEQNDKKQNFFINILRDWALVYKVTLAALTALLIILRNHTEHSYLPLDARTLLKTEQRTETSQISNGEYLHFGLERAVRSILRDYERKGIRMKQIKLGINVDGLEIFKSSREGLWLISCSEINSKEVYPVGAFFGKGKPDNANEFLKQFVDEATKLINYGLQEEDVSVSIEFLCCDTPAKAFVLYLKGHTGYDSCSKCNIGGVYVKSNPSKKNAKKNGQICFPGTGPFTLKSDSDELELNVRPIIADLPRFGFISSVPLDYMHLILLGVVKWLITLWVKGPLTVRLPMNKINKISKMLLILRHSTPVEFARRPRGLFDYAHWKATEFRTFHLYTGPIVLKNVLSPDVYAHFLLLHVAITILVNDNHISSIVRGLRPQLPTEQRQNSSNNEEEHVSYKIKRTRWDVPRYILVPSKSEAACTVKKCADENCEEDYVPVKVRYTRWDVPRYIQMPMTSTSEATCELYYHPTPKELLTVDNKNHEVQPQEQLLFEREIEIDNLLPELDYSLEELLIVEKLCNEEVDNTSKEEFDFEELFAFVDEIAQGFV
ncbi:uncharacterized protein LOC127278180 [Leptopilina boulardi]|uniref:uncharacterized protein LOC127278180 n=1 Tax=Leptopilina boulardi TaxID=63433 RepID=UPI0021F58B9A|nr:uncharacterized protein LOC127278180 [Leptopilina boulardi]